MKILLPPFSIIIFIHILSISTTTSKSLTLPKFQAILIFGDSTVDTGNNNYIHTVLKANHAPYGKDSQVPTGRFSNGKLIPDLVASLLGIKDNVPPFLDPNITNDELRTGVCFASAGSGYDNWTVDISKVIPVMKQIDYFKNYMERLKGFVGNDEAMKIINGSLVLISAGTNDFILNFYDIPSRRIEFTIDEYQHFLLEGMKNFVEELHNLGLRTMIIAGLPPIGCLPIQITSRFKLLPNDRRCLESENLHSRTYNQKLVKLLPKLQESLPGTLFAYADVYEPLNDMINNPQKYGFVQTNRGCCGTGFVETGPLCNEYSKLCANASQYLFWDCIHPSQAGYQYLSNDLVKKILSHLVKKPFPSYQTP
uniref:GDSL esterase/lipase n=1 Tax=Quercus lobata TaxID=97700 RepID=A0A7N2KNR4_QUELO